jgi:predicted RNA-binding protein with PIN domain
MYVSSPQAILLVDGYNIVGAWHYLKKTRDADSLEAARWQLIEALINYSAFKDFTTQIVFDAQYQQTSSNQEIKTENLLVHYTNFGETADTYIEKVCASYFRQYLHKSQLSRLIVATSDRTQQLMVTGYGAEWMSAQQLGYEVESASHQARCQHKPRKHSSGRFLANSIDAKARQRLAQLRLGVTSSHTINL